MKCIGFIILAILLCWTCSFGVTSGSAGDSKDARFPVTVVDGLGRGVVVTVLPERIISTVPSNTEILYDLGLKDKVVAVTTHCGKTCDVRGKCEIGGWADPSIVKQIVDLNPDLVIAFGGLQSPLVKEMEKYNITTYVVSPDTLEDVLKQIGDIGVLTGKDREANAVITRCLGVFGYIRDSLEGIPQKKRVRCLRLMSTDAMVIGGGSFQSDILTKAGGVNVFGDITEAYPIVNLESIKAKDPDVIIFNRDNEEEAIHSFLAKDGWNSLRAARDKRLMSISCDYICHPNTRIDRTVLMVARRLYPQHLPLIIKDARGEEVKVYTKPDRVVSVSTSTTEMLHALGLDEFIVGVTQFCPFPDLKERSAVVGTILDPDVEKIISLQPDLVFATVEGNRARTVEVLENAGIKVFVLDEVKSFEDLYKHIGTMGEIMQAEWRADRLINDMRGRINRISEKVGKEKRLDVFVQLGLRPIVTVNRDTIISEMVEKAGGVNIAGDILMRYQTYDRESIVARNPDVIVIVTMGDFEKDAVKDWHKYGNMAAVSTGRIYVIPAEILCNIGPRLADGVEYLARLFYPERFYEEGDGLQEE